VNYAAMNGQLAVLEYLLYTFPIPEKSQRYWGLFDNFAAERRRWSSALDDTFLNYSFQVMNTNDDELLRWFFALAKSLDRSLLCHDNVRILFHHAGAASYLMVKTCIDNADNLGITLFQAWCYAIERFMWGNHWGNVQALFSEIPQGQHQAVIDHIAADAVCHALASGHVRMAEFIWTNCATEMHATILKHENLIDRLLTATLKFNSASLVSFFWRHLTTAQQKAYFCKFLWFSQEGNKTQSVLDYYPDLRATYDVMEQQGETFNNQCLIS
ncbi:MAG: hypothetical protein KDH94_05405, partial [Coxiellaceae bacterium]|nr:hypothetical protein [Coxiellaceae bacterium]